MRSQCVVAGSVLLLLTVAESRFGRPPLDAFHLRAKAKTVKASGSVRALRLQQASESGLTSSGDIIWGGVLDPASNDPACKENAFWARVNSAFMPCVGYNDPTDNYTIDPTLAAHRSAWGTYCGSPCMKAMKANLIGSKYWTCMLPELQYSIALDDYMCSNRDSHGDFCGLTFSRLQLVDTCDSVADKSACVLRDAGCQWSDNSFPFGCNTVMTQTLLSGLCGDCLTGIANLITSYPRVEEWPIISIKTTQTLCATAPSGVYCQPLLANPAVLGFWSSNDAMAAFCKNDDWLTCVSGYMAAGSDIIISRAQYDFVVCAASYNNRSSDVTKLCLPKFQIAVASAVWTPIAAALCTRNNDVYCIPAYFAGVAFPNGSSQNGSSEDSNGCPTNAEALATKLGCCLGTIQSIDNTIATISTDPTLVPTIPGYTPPIVQTLPPPPPTQEPVAIGEGEELSPNPGSGGLFALGMCGVQGINETLRVRCAQNRFRVTKNLLVKLDYAAVTANEETKQAVLLSLRRDTARAAKVSPNQITNDSISATTRVQVTTASSRGMRVQASAPGVEYTYTVQASSKAQAEAASANVDAAVHTGYLDLSNTRSTVEQNCTACVGSDGTASISQVSSTTMGSVVTGASGSSMATALVSAVLAILLTLLALSH